MSAPYSTALLDQSAWDLVLDSNANVALASPPYSIAQDVSSAIRTFLGEVWYDSTIGVPYNSKILGKTPALTVFQQYMVNAALTVPGVVSAVCTLQSIQNRQVQGQVQFTDVNGQTTTITI